MRIFKFCVSLIIYLFVAGSIFAQNTGSSDLKKDSLLNNITNISKRIGNISSRDTSAGFSAPLKIDTVYAGIDTDFGAERDEKGLLIPENNWIPFTENVTFRDTVIFDPAFLPVIFDGRILPDDMDFMPKKSDSPGDFRLIPEKSTFAPELARMQHAQNMRRLYYMSNPQRIRLSAFNFVASEVLRDAAVVERRSVFKDLLTTDDAIAIARPELEKIEIRPVFWITHGEHSLQVNQNSISPNWNTGGNNNFNMLNYHKITLNYKKNKISFNNTIEWRLNMQQNSDNELRSINITDDNLQINSVLGISAFIKKWSYTITLETKTPLFNGYPVNSENKVRAILSPLQTNAGIGMEYKMEKVSKEDRYKKTTLSFDLAPFSLNHTFVGDKDVEVTRFGVEKDKRSRLDFGSTIKANLSVNFNRFSRFTSRLTYFTNYERALMESENRFNMSFSRFLSASLYYYLRFDDSVGHANKRKGWGYFQYNQQAGFGLSYTW
jgi:hypothetical protein